MSYIEYYKEKDTDPMVFLQRFRCTTEPIGGGTEQDEEGELVSWDAAVAALEIERKQFVEKACEILSQMLYTKRDDEPPAQHYVRSAKAMGEFITQTEFLGKFKNAMEE